MRKRPCSERVAKSASKVVLRNIDGGGARTKVVVHSRRRNQRQDVTIATTGHVPYGIFTIYLTPARNRTHRDGTGTTPKYLADIGLGSASERRSPRQGEN